jgi:site-specific DNA recombinase
VEGVERQIANIVNAIASGVTNETLLAKLEQQKLSLTQKLLAAKTVTKKAAITEDTLRQLLSQFGAHLVNRDLPEIKKFIGNSVDKVIVYQEHIEVILKLHIVGLEYGAEGSISILI